MTEGRPWSSFGGGREFPMLVKAGLRPLGSVFGACVMHTGYRESDVGGFAGDEWRTSIQAFETALARTREHLTKEADALGARFVADTTFAFPIELASVRKNAIGTVRATGTAFTEGVSSEPVAGTVLTNLTGTDLAQLLLAGYRPTGLCVGYSFWYQSLSYRSAPLQNGALGPLGLNVEHPDYSRAVKAAWTLARARLDRDARAAGGEAAVGLRIHMQTITPGWIAIILSATAVRSEGSLRGCEDPLLVIPLTG